jgi:hypothetical protein
MLCFALAVILAVTAPTAYAAELSDMLQAVPEETADGETLHSAIILHNLAVNEYLLIQHGNTGLTQGEHANVTIHGAVVGRTWNEAEGEWINRWQGADINIWLNDWRLLYTTVPINQSIPPEEEGEIPLLPLASGIIIGLLIVLVFSGGVRNSS